MKMHGCKRILQLYKFFIQNERDRLRVTERREQEAADQHQTRHNAQLSSDYNRLTFRNNPNDDYSFSRHAVIDTMTEVNPYCKL